jgi:hypothetical protein
LSTVSFTITSTGVTVTAGTHTFTYDGAITYDNYAYAPARKPAKTQARIVKKSNVAKHLFGTSINKIRK